MPPRMFAHSRTLPWLCLLALAACFRDSVEGNVAVAPQVAVPQSPPALTHEFGSVPHGEVRTHDFVLDVRKQVGEGWYSPGTHVDCSCARTELWLRGKDGSERQLAIYSSDTAPRDGESLVVRTILDTGKREAVDTKDLDSRVLVVLQRVDSRDPQQRVMWPLQFRFRVDAPVRVRPVATIDFERVAPAKPRRVTLNLSSDVPGRAIAFQNPKCEDPRVQLALEANDGFTLLHASLMPQQGDSGNLRAIVTVDTDLESGYQLRIAAVAAFVPDMEAIPLPKLAIRADLRQAQREDKAGTQYVLATDHDESRPEDFVVARIVDANSKDASASWAITLEPVVGEPRSRRVHARWIGSSTTEFRGELVLCKDVARGPYLPIELVALHDKNP
jgi:hypothetical protein